MTRRKNFLIIFMAALLAVTFSAPLRAEDAAPTEVVVRVGEHEGYDRIVFDWPKATPYKVIQDGGYVEIHFSAPGSVQLRPTAHLTRCRNFISRADTDGNLVVSFVIDSKSTIKDFFSGPSIAVDITGVPVRQAAKESSTPLPEEKKATAAAPAAETKPAAPAGPSSAALPAPSKEVAAPAPPAAPALPAPASSQPIAVSIGTAKAEAPPAPPPSAPAAASTTVPVTQPATPQPFSAENYKPRQIPNITIGTKPVLAATLSPHIQARAVIWTRAGYGYIVFDKKITLTVDQLTAGFPAPIVTLEPLDLPKGSGFRFAVPDKVEVHASRDDTVWQLYLSKLQPDVPVTATLVAQPDFALGARFILPLPDAPEPIRFTDPVVGDDLIVLPLNQAQAFTILRHNADFDVWPATQGLVIKPLNDKLVVRSVSDGIEVTADNGLHLSPSSDTGEEQQSAQKAKSTATGKSLFDFATWRGKSNETFTEARQRLQQTVVDVPERERDRARLELARFYFARGYGLEAVGLLNYLAKDIPDLAAHNDFQAMLGASKIVADRPEEGVKDLEAANLPDLAEIKLWQAVAAAKLGNWTEAEEKFASTENLLTGYPEPFYSHFWVLAIESALAVGNDHEAADWLNLMDTAPHNPEINPALNYLHGVLHAKAGQMQAAMHAWKLAAISNDRLYKVRAEMALIDLDVANASLSPSQAADRLEALRYAWRGDNLEIDILHRLGLFYLKTKNVKTGLQVLSQALQLYPHSALASKIHEEMTQTFHDVFLGELGDKMTPLEALTVYQQYRDTLMPSGDDGIAVTRNLAERLAAVDLIDQAADLLEDIAKNKLTGVEKGKVVVRLAALRLIDHKPQAALDALDLSTNDFLPEKIAQDRLFLRAKALSEMDHGDEALALIKDNTTLPAKILRADINMTFQHWQEASKNLLDLVGPAPPPGEGLRGDQVDWLVRCAIAMAMAGDQAGLDHLAIDYGAAMAGTAQNDTFRILVQPEKPGQLRDIAAAQSRISDVDMFQGFLDSYRKADSSTAAAVKKP